MNARGERILIFGDSLTQHASGANPIWNVDAGPQRSSSGPGDLLASLLLDQGATVRTNALVSRSAVNFWTREPAQDLIAADRTWRPTKVVFVLGTNDVGLNAAADYAAFVRLRDAYKAPGVELWAIGPFTSRLPAAGIAVVAATMRKVFGARFIDGRPLSRLISPGPDGVHYTPTSARLLALNLADALLSAAPVRPWVGIAIGAGIVVGGALIYGLATGRARGLAGAKYSKFYVRPHSYPISFRKEPHGQYAIFQRPNDFMVKYAPVVEDIAKIEPSTKIGTFKDIDEAHASIDAHHVARTRGLAGVEIVDGRRWGGTTNELIRAGYKPTPCKSGLDRGGQARCWSRGLGEIGGSRVLKISTKDPASMTPAQVNAELDKLDARDSELVRAMIEAGRGHERPSEYLHKDDPLSSEMRAIHERRARLGREIALRYGPGAPSRMPRGLKRRELGSTEADDDDEPRPGEDDETWWQRLLRQARRGQDRMQAALDQHDALILTTRGGRRILVLKTPEMSDPAEGPLRVTTFDEDGPIGHTTRRSLEALAEDVYRDWHPETITPASEAEVLAWTGTERFARGAAAVAEMQRRNLITEG